MVTKRECVARLLSLIRLAKSHGRWWNNRGKVMDEQDIQSMNYILEKSNNTDWPNLLNAQELEYFEKDLAAVKEWVNCIDE